jgi:hypothetical protein
MKPIPFFLGLVIGLFSLSIVGRSIQNTPLAQSFVRFHAHNNAEAGFLTTAAELATIIDQQPPARAYIIVGGSSVLNGVGQSRDLVWTRRLQNLLGKEFVVLNFANRAGGPIDFGSVAAEMLLRQHRPVIYVADANETVYANNPRTSFYRHMLFDGWLRSYLLPWPPRDAYLRWAAFDGDEGVRNVALGEWLNSFLRFNELWNYITFNFVGLQWNNMMTAKSFSPFRRRSDPGASPEVSRTTKYRGNNDADLAIVAAQAGRPIERMIANASLTEQFVPLQLRSITLVVVDLLSPYYLDLLPGSREALLARATEQQAAMQKMGFNKAMIPAKDFTADDYADRVHLSVDGGDKMAAALAPVVRQMASDLGYLR